MGELYNLYPKLPRNIKQIGEKEETTRLYVEDYVSTSVSYTHLTLPTILRV